MIEHFAKFIPEELMDMSGSVFYSGKNAFQGKKNLYVLGLNPGGSDIIQKNETLRWHTEKLLNTTNPNFSEYKDGIWGNKEAGKSGLQPRILHLLKRLELNPYEVPASNICFVRSPREINIADKIDNYMDLCWPFHSNVMENTILCFGKTAGNYVRKKTESNYLIDEFIEKNSRNWKTEVYTNNLGKNVIVATHPSIADWTNKNTDISELVKKYL